jgi:hypothetical protein
MVVIGRSELIYKSRHDIIPPEYIIQKADYNGIDI